MLEKILTGSKILFFLSVSFFFIFLAIRVDNQLTSVRKDVNLQVNQFRSETIKLVNTRFDSLQNTTTDWLKLSDSRIDSIQNLVDHRLESLQTFAGEHLDSLQKDALARIDTVSNDLNTQLTSVNDHIGTLTNAWASVPAAVGARLDRQTNCTINQLCWQNMTTDMMRDARYAAMDMSEASKTFKTGWPTMVNNTTNITTSWANTSNNIDRLTKPHWYDRALGYGLNGMILFRQFHPGALVVKTVTEAVSSQK